MTASVVRAGRSRIWPPWIVAVMATLILVVAWGCNRGVKPAPPVVETVDAAQTLRLMSDTLGRAHQLTFKAKRQLDAALVEGSNIAESADIEVAVSRPRMVRARLVSPAGVRRFYADGQSISLLDESMKLYATVPVSGTIDEVVDALDEKYGFTPPLAEFVLNDPYQKFSKQIQNSVYRGKETVNGVECDHLGLTGQIADADVWISRADHLPQKFLATFKDRDGSPQLKVDFSDWNLAATLEESAFTFDPPKDAARITMAAAEDVKPPEGKAGTSGKAAK
jgi:hypothetical protein